MHNMKSNMNKKAMLNSYPETIHGSDESVPLEVNKSQNIPMINIERENRLSRIISLYSKGLTQSEIASEIGIDQSTVSRELQFIKQEAKQKIEKYLNEDEPVMILVGSGHLAGEGSVISRLRDRGVKLTQMEYHTTRPR